MLKITGVQMKHFVPIPLHDHVCIFSCADGGSILEIHYLLLLELTPE